MPAQSTQLRYIISSDKDRITLFVSRLGFKIEIKQIVKDKNKWCLWYNLARGSKDIGNVSLD